MSPKRRQPDSPAPPTEPPSRGPRPVKVAAVVVALAVVSAGAWRLWRGGATDALAGPPNVLLVTLDTTRADHVGAYGASAARTPTLDRLAQEGVLFERAVAAAPTTLPAHASLMTGRNPMAHGVRNNGVPLPNDVPTLATAFREAGYRTGAFVSAFVLDQRFGLGRGFDTYDDRLDPSASRGNDELDRSGDRTAATAAKWLASVASGPPAVASSSTPPTPPFFVWVHLYDPHDPYEPADSCGRGAASPYDGEITCADAAVGTLLAALDERGLTANTIVAVIGDHGESLGEHGEATHGMFVYDAAMRVPALLKWPARLSAGTRVSPLVRAIDLAPTLLDLAGVKPLAGATGLSLAPLAHRTTFAPAPATAYGETYFPQLFMNWAPLRSIRDGQWKFIEAPTLELYDLAADPGETSNVATREPERVGRLRRELHALDQSESAAPARTGLDRETTRKLTALGYVGGSGSASAGDPLARPDPKAMIEVFNLLRGANSALEAGRLDDASRVARETLTTDRENAFARLILAKAARARRQYADAAAHFRAYLAQVPQSADAHHWLAICQLQLGDFDAALAEVELALAIDPRFAEARTLRGDLLVAAGRIEEGLHDLRAAVNVNPDRPAAHIALGRTLIRVGQSANGEEQYRYALDLAERFAASGRESQAALAWDQLLAEPTVPAAVRDRARAQRGGAPR